MFEYKRYDQGETSGPNAYSHVRLFNQRCWDASPEKADQAVAKAIASGGFVDDCIRREVGNYEGQIMAIRRGFVTKEAYGWRLSVAGRDFLSRRGVPAPAFLKARDDWHSRDNNEREFEFCLWETERDGKSYLKFAKELYPRISVGMDPLFSREHVAALRDFLSEWLESTS